MEAQIYNAEYTIRVSDADIELYQMVYFPKKLYTVNHVHSHPEYESYCKNLFSILLLHIQRSFTKQAAAKTSREAKLENTYMIIDLFFNRIFGHEGQNLTMEELSSQLHISSRHLNRLLQEHYGVTFHEKLMATKIKYAEYLLKTTDCSVGEISTMCGVTAACLIDNFKKIHGVTPAKYRKFNETDTV